METDTAGEPGNDGQVPPRSIMVVPAQPTACFECQARSRPYLPQKSSRWANRIPLMRYKLDSREFRQGALLIVELTTVGSPNGRGRSARLGTGQVRPRCRSSAGKAKSSYNGTFTSFFDRSVNPSSFWDDRNQFIHRTGRSVSVAQNAKRTGGGDDLALSTRADTPSARVFARSSQH